ncbi:MAG: LysR family transcriptional regulator [Oscillospiraceae bacterium]|nr:LysR family transcriptional regulator [Oscillospiraceae bacterium]
MEIRTLKYFLAVAEEENITAAASKLHMTQPALSRQMMDLEKSIGKPLFIRTNKKTYLTEDGLYLKQRAQEILSLVDKTASELQTTSGEIYGQIHFGAGETDSMRIFADVTGRIHQKYPKIQFNLFSGNADDILEKLENGVLDFGLIFSTTFPETYHYMPVPLSNARGLLMRRDSPWAKYGRITVDLLKQMPLITPSRTSYNQNFLSQWCGKDVDSLHIVATYNLIFNAVFLVEAGIGNALCLENLVNTEHSSTLCFCPLDPPSYAVPMLIWKKGKKLSKASAVFLEEIKKTLRDIADMASPLSAPKQQD